jgi:hypothetical protein
MVLDAAQETLKIDDSLDGVTVNSALAPRLP